MSGFNLKFLALILMLIEHFFRFFYFLFPENFLTISLYIGRIVLPIFFFLAVEGYHKTSSKKNYISRLYFWSGIMFLGNVLCYLLVLHFFPTERIFLLPQNIFFSIATGVSLIWSIDTMKENFKKHEDRFIIGLFGILLSVFFGYLSEASFMGLGLFLVFYIAYQRSTLLSILFSFFCGIFFILGKVGIMEQINMIDFQWFMIIALPFLLMYNGKQGKYRFKYLFYTIYPLHIWLFYFGHFYFQ